MATGSRGAFGRDARANARLAVGEAWLQTSAAKCAANLQAWPQGPGHGHRENDDEKPARVSEVRKRVVVPDPSFAAARAGNFRGTQRRTQDHWGMSRAAPRSGLCHAAALVFPRGETGRPNSERSEERRVGKECRS